MDLHSKWNVTQNGMSLEMECHSNLNVTQMEYYLNKLSLKGLLTPRDH